MAATPQAADRRRGLAVWSAVGAAAGVSGYLLGGVLTGLVGWRAIFWINLPLAVIIAAGVLRHAVSGRQENGSPMDLPGALLFTAAVMSLVLAGSQLQMPGHLSIGLLLVAVAVGLTTALVSVERRAPNPLLPFEALRQRALRAGVGTALLNTATTSSVIAIATLQLQRTQRLSPAAAGLLLMPCSICVIAGSSIAARALERLAKKRVIALGLTLIAAGDGLLTAQHSSWILSLGVGIAGAGLGISSVAANSLGTDVDPALQATAAGALNTAAQLGTTIGVSALLLLTTTKAQIHLPLQGPRLGWAVASAVAFTGATFAAFSNRSGIPAQDTNPSRKIHRP
jgi:MFS family permease